MAHLTVQGHPPARATLRCHPERSRAVFDHFVWSVVICPIAVAVAVRLLADRMRPDAAARFLVGSLAVAAAACLVTLATFALKAFAELPLTGALLHFSDAYVRADT